MATSEANKPAKTATKESGFDYVRTGMDNYPAPVRVMGNVVLFLVWVFFKIFYPSKIEREQYLVEQLKAQGSMVVQNHTSMVEPVAVIVALWRHGIHVRPIYKLEFEKIGPAKWLFRRIGGIPINRGAADMRAIRAAKDALVRGECVLVYPEGTRIKSDQDVPEVRGGFAMIAQMANAPVIPMAVAGAADPNHTRKTLRKTPVFAVGDALRFDELEGESRKAKQEQMETVAMQRVYELRDGLRKRYPGLW